MGRKKNEAPERVKLSLEETNALKLRIEEQNLEPKDFAIFLDVLQFHIWMQERLSKAKLTTKRLRNLFGFKNEAKDKPKNPEDDNKTPKLPLGHDEGSVDTNQGKDPIDTSKDILPKATKKEPKWDSNKNHGRRSVSDYSGCPETDVPFQDKTLQQGYCPNCAKVDTIAKTTPKEPRSVVMFDSQPMISATIYKLSRSRCCVCETYFVAELPEEVKNEPKYSIRCKTALAIQHYYGGLPFNRIEMLQEAQGVPVADSTQFDLVNELYESAVEPVFNALEKYGAQGDVNFFDDSAGRIVEQITHNKKQTSNNDKNSIHATAILSEYNGHKVSLFYTNTLTSGKQLADCFSKRENPEEFITMSDASPHNFPTLDDNLIARWIICLCLAHGRRKFFELLGDCDPKAFFVLELIAKIYENESYCKKNELSDKDRLEYHQKNSAPLMDALYVWFNNLLLYREVEPNSVFGEAVAYMLKRWHWLTQFLRVLGAPIDNNICEQAIKVIIRYRKNSLFYKTFYGARIGDAMMSLMHTAIKNTINIFDYLNALQEYTKEVNITPENWLPWRYQETIIQLNASTPIAINSS